MNSSDNSDLNEVRVDVGDLTFDAAVNDVGLYNGLDPSESVLLLHGFPQSKASWLPVMARLGRAGVPAIAFDQRGYSPGARPSTVADYCLENLVADVVNFCDATELERVYLVGHDWGAIVAWATTAARPDRISSLTAVSVPHPAAFAWAIASDPDQRQRSAYMDSLRDDPSMADLMTADDGAGLRAAYEGVVADDLIERHVEVLMQPGAMASAINWYRANGDDDLAAIAPANRPTTLIWGENDVAVGAASIARCGDHVTGEYRTIRLPGITHWVPEQAPDAVVSAVLDGMG
ncbi:alpha/beta fold hydrolase [Gordonia rhizosphera]|uniref:Putative epoxide hydrolase n=1 Tax=Gordonia rhizosphera NBRC 16068 TaxID=1108045 RepID=K6WFW0_9ACTN|nr:alpha/beta hydrolase [Gordonia rhizosphera]GAB92656.1 putative epoxide hydrolase [Gordonia rhizosphera NBRC 16068]